MSKNNIFIITLILVMVFGFYFVLTEINNVEKQVRNIKSSAGSVISGATVTEGSKAISTEEIDKNENIESTSIPTAILFKSQSSPLLEPQTNLTIAVESIEKTKDGEINVNIKTYTNEASSYSALQPNNIFEVVNIGNENQKPLKVTGNFDSMPPQSAVTGKVTFKVSKNTDEIILQVKTRSEVKHFKFNFENQTYEEAVLG